MPFNVYFLESSEGTPVTKVFYKDQNGNVTKSNFNNIYRVDSYEYKINTLDEFYNAILRHANNKHCLIKGLLDKALINEPRKGHTKAQDSTMWVCLDPDRIAGIKDPEHFIKTCLPDYMHDVSYIHQYSSSSGFDPEYSAHIFMLLERETSAPLLKQWLKTLNLDNPTLRSQLSLTANAQTLKWPLDITTCQNDKLIYIGTPTFRDGIQDPFDTNGKKRLELIIKKRNAFSPVFDNRTPAAIEELEAEVVNDLRISQGLKKKVAKYKTLNGIRVLSNPGIAQVTGEVRHERGFVYFNVNGGDSYAYYYPENNPKYVYNFKGEPTYLMEEFVPDYYDQVIQHNLTKEKKIKPIVFRDIRTDTYYNGVFDLNKDKLDLYQVSSKDKMEDFMTNHGLPLPDPIEDWNYYFDPTDTTTIDFKRKKVNKYSKTPYLRNHTMNVPDVPPTIKKILESVTGNDQESYDYFVNWLAYIYQERKKPMTAWILHGVEGTGKGVLFHQILAPTLGQNHCKIMTVSDFDDSFNDWLEECLLLFVDEVHIDGSKKTTLNKLKNLITEPQGRIRGMHKKAIQVPLFNSMIFASNELDAMYISPTDRRFNVAARQEHKLVFNEGEFENIQNELQDFVGYMMEYDVNAAKVRTPLQNSAKETMRDAALNSVERFFNAIIMGNLDYLIDLGSIKPPIEQQMLYQDNINVLKRWAKYANGEACCVTRDEIFTVYRYLHAGNTSMSVNKFSRLLAHNKVNITRMRVTGENIHDFKEERITGIMVNWICNLHNLSSLDVKPKVHSNDNQHTAIV